MKNNILYFTQQQEEVRNSFLYADAKPLNKLVYMNHNFASNYHAASGAGDTQMKADIVLSEIAKLIVNRPDSVRSLLAKYGKPSTGGTKQLVSHVSDAINTSRPFSTDLVRLMAERPLNADGTPQKGGNVAGIISSTSDLVNGLGNLFGGKKKAKAEADKAKAAAQAALNDKANVISGGTASGGFNMKYILIGFAAVVVIGGIVYMVKK